MFVLTEMSVLLYTYVFVYQVHHVGPHGDGAAM